jgi:hypothetical protein
MQDLMLRAYKASIAMEPIALRDYYVKIITYQQEFFRKVTFYEILPPFQGVNVGALGAGVQSAKTQITNLDLWDNEFGQWRWYPLDNVQVRLFLPSGVGKWQLKNLQVPLDRSILYRDPTLVTTEFFSWEDQRPSVECLNFTDYALLASRIVFTGYRFHTENVTADKLAQLKNGTQVYTPVQCSGMAGGGD